MNKSIIERMISYQNSYNKDMLHFMSDPLYNMRKHCKSLYKEFKMYNMVNYKIPFTSEETINFEKMLESKDEYSLQLCKQIILTKLNNE